jgi:Arc/MetJ-type ribon-helix-helix transcriptional regulator
MSAQRQYVGGMKTKTSVTLDGGLLRGIAQHAGDYRSRSEFIEVAVEYFIKHLDREEAERKDLEILNRRADVLNEEAEDVLAYQVPL